MSSMLISLIIQAVGGAIGGNAIGSGFKNVNLGTIGNTIAGAIGGAGGWSILGALVPGLASAGGLDISAIVSQLIGGGVTGAIVTGAIGAIVNGMQQKKA